LLLVIVVTFKVTPLQVYGIRPAFLPLGNTAGTDILKLHVEQSVIVLEFQRHPRNRPFKLKFHYRKQEKVMGGHMRLVGNVGDHSHIFGGQKLHYTYKAVCTSTLSQQTNQSCFPIIVDIFGEFPFSDTAKPPCSNGG
jgi:hypothetical protein